jgi:Tfp pilus assembly protein PilO
MNLKLSKEQIEKIILGAIGGLVVLLVILNYVLAPRLKRIRSLKEDIQGAEEKINTAKADIEGVSQLKTDLSKMGEKSKKYRENMPKPDPDWLLNRLNSLAEETGINFNKMEPLGSVKKGKYFVQEMDIELITDYHSLGKFINKLENSSPFLRVTDLSILKKEDDVLRHYIKLKIGAYFTESGT